MRFLPKKPKKWGDWKKKILRYDTNKVNNNNTNPNSCDIIYARGVATFFLVAHFSQNLKRKK